jgi:hypothetical protein
LNEEFIDEEFKHGDVHEDVEDPSQGFVDWDSLPTYDSNIDASQFYPFWLNSTLDEFY